MVYIIETEIFNKKPLIFSLSSIYGMGQAQSIELCRKLGYSENLTISDLTKDQVLDLVCKIEKSDFVLTKDLKRNQALLLQRKINIKLYKGLRLIRGLPVRGQRTHTNAKTVKRFKRNK